MCIRDRETRQLADMITRDVREADGEIKTATATYPSGIAFFNCSPCDITKYSGSSWDKRPQIATSFEEIASGITYAQVLAIATKDEYRVYLSSRVKNHIYYKTFPRLDLSGNVITLTSADIISVKEDHDLVTGKRNNRISLANTETRIAFAGFGPDSSSIVHQQAFVSFYIVSQSRSSVDEDIYVSPETAESSTYDELSVKDRARSELRSAVTVRNYKAD
jgi:hypothetical protein